MTARPELRGDRGVADYTVYFGQGLDTLRSAYVVILDPVSDAWVLRVRRPFFGEPSIFGVVEYPQVGVEMDQNERNIVVRLYILRIY